MIFIGTEAIAWIILFNKDLRKIAHRLRQSHEQFAAIKDNIMDIKEHISDVAEYVVKGEESEEIQESKEIQETNKELITEENR